VKSDPQPEPDEGQLIDWYGRKVLVVPNGTGRGRRGPGTSRTRFTPAVVAELRRQAKTIPVRELARRHGVSRQYIYLLIGPKSPKPRKR